MRSLLVVGLLVVLAALLAVAFLAQRRKDSGPTAPPPVAADVRASTPRSPPAKRPAPPRDAQAPPAAADQTPPDEDRGAGGTSEVSAEVGRAAARFVSVVEASRDWDRLAAGRGRPVDDEERTELARLSSGALQAAYPIIGGLRDGSLADADATRQLHDIARRYRDSYCGRAGLDPEEFDRLFPPRAP